MHAHESMEEHRLFPSCQALERLLRHDGEERSIGIRQNAFVLRCRELLASLQSASSFGPLPCFASKTPRTRIIVSSPLGPRQQARRGVSADISSREGTLTKQVKLWSEPK